MTTQSDFNSKFSLFRNFFRGPSIRLSNCKTGNCKNSGFLCQMAKFDFKWYRTADLDVGYV